MARKQHTIIIFIALILLTFAVSHANAANVGAGIVKVNELRLRAEPTTDSAELGYANKGDNLVIIKWANSEWYEVICNRTRAFVKAEFVAPTESFEFDVGEGEITGDSVRLRKTPGFDGEVIKTLELDTSVEVVGVNGEWYKAKVGGTTGYINSDFVRIIASATAAVDTGAPFNIDGDTSTATAAKTPKKATSSYTNDAKDLTFDSSTTIGAMAELAVSFLGTKYVYGGASSKGFDCSGFTYYLAKQYGYELPHSASAQQKLGVKVEKDQLKQGDLVFFGPGGRTNHVGLYLGDGVFIHASSGGSCVKYNNLTDQYYQVNYRGARRVF